MPENDTASPMLTEPLPPATRPAPGAAAGAEECVVWYIEDDPAVALGSTQSLQLAGFEVRSHERAEDALAALQPGLPIVIVTDVRLPGMDGIALLERVRHLDADLPVILVTGHGDITMAVQAMRLGAYDFIEKPYSPERLVEVVRRAVEKRRLSLEVSALRSRLEAQGAIEAKLIGRSSAMSRLRGVILDIASMNADVLITGETGCGKELVARCLHDFGRRRSGNFAAINCGGLPETLFESEVFGHEAGSFTGAARRRIGKIEHAAGGTLFLDEIESMPMPLQIKLLRALQERQFERLGSNELQPMDCRVIAATKTDLLNPPPEHPFRADLYYRLSVVVLHIPPLRERREDIPQLFMHFVMQAAAKFERRAPEVDSALMRELVAHAWPGNVRELRNAADRWVLGLPWLDSGQGGPAPLRGVRSLEEQVAVFEQHLIEDALSACGGRVSAVSELLKTPKATLYDKIRKYGIDTEAARGANGSGGRGA